MKVESVSELSRYLADACGAMEEHVRCYHFSGNCRDLHDHHLAWKKETTFEAIQKMLLKGFTNQRVIRRLRREGYTQIVDELQALIPLPLRVRMSVFQEGNRRDNRTDVIMGKVEELVSMGYSRSIAHEIMREAGPGRCISVAKWAEDACQILPTVSLECLFLGALSSNVLSKQEKLEALSLAGLGPLKVRSHGQLSGFLRAALIVLHAKTDLRKR